MSHLDIRPHSRRISGWAIALLCLLAAGSLAFGALRQLKEATSSPFPAAPEPSLQISAAPADIAPPVPQVAAAAPPARPAAPPKTSEDAPPPPAETPGADTAATATAAAPPPPPPPAPAPADAAPATPDPPT